MHLNHRDPRNAIYRTFTSHDVDRSGIDMINSHGGTRRVVPSLATGWSHTHGRNPLGRSHDRGGRHHRAIDVSGPGSGYVILIATPLKRTEDGTGNVHLLPD